MPPKTRSRAQANDTDSRTYHSSPALHQTQFPAPRRSVKTYGRHSSSARSLRQQTLTQIYDINQVDLDNLVSPTPMQDHQRPQKRRKTQGDSPSSSFHTQTLTQLISEHGDGSNENDGNLLPVQDQGEGEGEGEGRVENQVTEEREEEDEWEGLDEPPHPLDGKNERLQMGKSPYKESRESRATSVIPQTPSHQRIKIALDEVPSSQPSPFTPMLDRFASQQYRSPLTQRSTNMTVPPPTLLSDLKKSQRPRTLVIQDSYATVASSLHSDPAPSPSKDSLVEKPRREPLAEIPVSSLELGEAPYTMIGEVETPTRPRNSNKENVNAEIPDSDDDFGSLGPSPSKATLTPQTPLVEIDIDDASEEIGTPSPVPRYVRPSSELGEGVPEHPRDDGEPQLEHTVVPEEILEPEDMGGALRDATKNSEEAPPAEDAREIDIELSDFEEEPLEPSTPTPKPRRVQIDLPPASAEEEILAETPIKQPPPQKPLPPAGQHTQARHTQSRHTQSRHTQARHTQSRHTQARHTQARSQYYSQGLESQRVPHEVIRSMGPQTDRSDVALSIHPSVVDEIVDGSRDHEFRNFKLPVSVSRIWIYITDPKCELKYMATIGPAKQPGEIDGDSGIGNAEFNSGQSGFQFAYELFQVYQLNNPQSLQRLKDDGWIKTAPTRYEYLPPTAVGNLLSNLRCALFDEEHGEEHDGHEISTEGESRTKVTVSQELEDQIRGDIIHQTQVAPSEMQDAIIPASQEEQPPNAAHSQRQHVRNQSSQKKAAPVPVPTATAIAAAKKANFVSCSQATTASEPSTPEESSHESSAAFTRPALSSSGPSLPGYAPEVLHSPVRGPRPRGNHVSLHSSEAALLPDSLLVDNVRQPPIIWDSEEEEGDIL